MHKVLIFIITMLFYLPASAQQHQGHSLYGSHGMVLLNVPTLGHVASHLPLYSTPHDYQILYQVHLSDQEKLAQLNSPIVTILPDNFDLTRLVTKQQFTINAKVFSGHFERGGQYVFDSKITFEQPLIVEQLKNESLIENAHFFQYPINQEQELIVHKIQPAPSFDVIGLRTITKNPVECSKPAKLEQSFLEAHLAECGISQILYIETQDFK